MSAPSVRRVDQRMAAQAARLLPSKIDPELRTRYRQLRVMVHSAGLAATYAFVAAKGNGVGEVEGAYRQVAEGIRAHLARCGVLPDAEGYDDRRMLQELGELELGDYARAGAEVTALTTWLSRLADALYQAGIDTGSETAGDDVAEDTSGEAPNASR
ncbi:MAG: type III-B CRISPR module-associated protein Cmr5 [Streptomycetales bacterium]